MRPPASTWFLKVSTIGTDTSTTGSPGVGGLSFGRRRRRKGDHGETGQSREPGERHEPPAVFGALVEGRSGKTLPRFGPGRQAAASHGNRRGREPARRRAG